MSSIILSALSRLLLIVMLGASLFILYRGHNFPGGGFVGGLVAASGFAILAMAEGGAVARRALRFHPLAIAGTGLLLAAMSGLPGLLTRGSFLTHWWFHAGRFHTGTALVFDIGVYLVVIGGVFAMVLCFQEEEDAQP